MDKRWKGVEVDSERKGFQKINRGYGSAFRPGKLSLGLTVPIEAYPSGPVPTMNGNLGRVQLAEALGFAAVWLRDVPFNVPSFGDAGQMYDPFVYLGLLAGSTERIALGVASIVLPLRHPAHVAKAAATADVLSGGRLLLGVASGDRPDEYPALNLPFEDRAERFRDSFAYIRRMADTTPEFENGYGHPGNGMDMLPKPVGGKLPMLVTGSSRQDPEWLARNGDGWITYPRDPVQQGKVLSNWRGRMQELGRPDQPAVQSLYVDLVKDAGARPTPIHLGFRSGVDYLVEYLRAIQEIGINHVALNLRFNQDVVESTMKRLAENVLPEFS